MKIRSLFCLLFGLSGCLGALPTPAIAGTGPAGSSAGATASLLQGAAGAPQRLIGRLDDTLLATMKQAQILGYAGRYRSLAPTVERAYDFATVAKVVLGPRWTRFSAAQQHEFLAALTDYTVATYAARFDGYAGERFAIRSVRSIQANRAVVNTVLTESDGTAHRLDYLLQRQRSNGQWRIVNVVADGVSDLALKHAEFAHLLDTKGFPGLIAGLKRYTARLARGAH